MKIAKMRRALRTLTGSSTRAAWAAEVLDDVVNSEVAALPRLSEDARYRSADQLAELVLLAQDYRHFADGRITSRELQRRGEATLLRLELNRHPPMQQLIERE